MKTIAFYLPQFHEIPENNAWWGKGYTEWVSVREAKPLYLGHYQPTEPLDDNYYDLTNSETLEWQAKLAKEYGVYGFCFYHYWFSGKLILEKPAELLLKHKEIDLHFCFSWANESWIRTWNREEGNSWNVVYDDKIQNKSDGMLLKQEYGDKKEWVNHFFYLLPFFQDSRYIKKDGEPVILLYKPREIKCIHSMLKTWNELAVLNGFSGLYVVATNDCSIQNPFIRANAIFEPAYLTKHLNKLQSFIFDYVCKKRREGKKIPLIRSYHYAWKKILGRKFQGSRKTFLGGFVKFDKTPREGKNAWMYIGASPERFHKYFERLVHMSVGLENEFVFLNAWNEWGEGAYLEPDKKNGTAYLKAVKDVMSSVL